MILAPRCVEAICFGSILLGCLVGLRRPDSGHATCFGIVFFDNLPRGIDGL
jgi:hypothetical protein